MYFAHVGAADRPWRNGARSGSCGFGSGPGADGGPSFDWLLAGPIFCAAAGDVFLLRHIVRNRHADVWSFGKDSAGRGVPGWNGSGRGGRHHRVFADALLRSESVWLSVWLCIWLLPAGGCAGGLFYGGWLRVI